MGDTLTVAAPKDNLKKINAENLYALEIVVDPEAGEIKVLRPITAGGVRDTARAIRFFGSITVTLMGMGMPRQVAFEIDAATLDVAVDQWESTARAAGEKFVSDAESARIKAQLAGGTHAARMLNS